MHLIIGIILGILIGSFIVLTIIGCNGERWMWSETDIKPTYRGSVREMIRPFDPWYAWIILTLMYPGMVLGHWLEKRKWTRQLAKSIEQH